MTNGSREHKQHENWYMRPRVSQFWLLQVRRTWLESISFRFCKSAQLYSLVRRLGYITRYRFVCRATGRYFIAYDADDDGGDDGGGGLVAWRRSDDVINLISRAAAVHPERLQIAAAWLAMNNMRVRGRLRQCVGEDRSDDWSVGRGLQASCDSSRGSINGLLLIRTLAPDSRLFLSNRCCRLISCYSVYLFIYLLCKSYQGTEKIMQKSIKREKKHKQKNTKNTSHGAYSSYLNLMH